MGLSSCFLSKTTVLPIPLRNEIFVLQALTECSCAKFFLKLAFFLVIITSHELR